MIDEHGRYVADQAWKRSVRIALVGALLFIAAGSCASALRGTDNRDAWTIELDSMYARMERNELAAQDTAAMHEAARRIMVIQRYEATR